MEEERQPIRSAEFLIPILVFPTGESNAEVAERFARSTVPEGYYNF